MGLTEIENKIIGIGKLFIKFIGFNKDSKTNVRAGYMRISDVIISDEFKSTNPRVEKYNRHMLNIITNHGCQTEEIVINENGVLVDGYIQYLILKQLNEKMTWFIKE